MDSGYDAGGESALETKIASLRQQLHDRGIACRDMVAEFESNRELGLSADDGTTRAIDRYEETASALLGFVPDDEDATAALSEAEKLKKRVAED